MKRKIIKYENRKYYIKGNRQAKKSGYYVTATDLAQFVKQGDTLEVVRQKTGEDITEQTLKNILTQCFNNANLTQDDIETLIKQY